MHVFTFQLVLLLVFAETSANIPSIIQRGYGSCTFANETCGYDVRSPWAIHKGSYELMGRPLLQDGQDDAYYVLFEPPPPNGQSFIPISSMSSSPLSAGAACLSFYYTLPASMATLHVMTRTKNNVTMELWNVTNRSFRTWTLERLFLDNGLLMIERANRARKVLRETTYTICTPFFIRGKAQSHYDAGGAPLRDTGSTGMNRGSTGMNRGSIRDDRDEPGKTGAPPGK
ncbi:hypothetical protein DPMN_110569 [Dreissena polymorpha]|uniref:MAM domain-containing protein n=1 Tax=Dreissena polymorpha TaxID=45954 RepID=A0A9D4KCX0_DREPO|nr:hypothetical protein DPMN_110569 [Dreissena polymorpha]